jgi:hypothetical protein
VQSSSNSLDCPRFFARMRCVCKRKHTCVDHRKLSYLAVMIAAGRQIAAGRHRRVGGGVLKGKGVAPRDGFDDIASRS